MSETRHLTDADQLDLLAGRLEAAQQADADAHLASGCVRCAEARQFAERIFAAAAEDLEEPPGATLSRGRGAFRAARRPGVAARVRERKLNVTVS